MISGFQLEAHLVGGGGGPYYITNMYHSKHSLHIHDVYLITNYTHLDQTQGAYIYFSVVCFTYRSWFSFCCTDGRWSGRAPPLY